MIKPLSRFERNAYLLLGVVLFLILIPILILYSEGYRFTDTFRLEKTGGIYVRSDVADTSIYIDNELTEETGLLIRNSFIQDMSAGAYEVRVEKNGYRTWNKKVIVEENLVTEIHHIPILEQIASTTISRFIVNSETGTTTRVRDPRYDDFLELFATTTATTSSATIAANSKPVQRATTTTVVIDERTTKPGFLDENGVYSWIEGGDVVMVWTGGYDRTPFFFCQGTDCVSTSTVSLEAPILKYDFTPTIPDSVLALTANGLYVVDVDTRSKPNEYLILEGKGMDMRTDGSNVIVRKDGTFIVFEL